MKIFEMLYKEYILQFQQYFANINYNINQNSFQHNFLTNCIPYQITITFPKINEDITKSIAKWIYKNPFIFSRLINNKTILKGYLIRNGLIPKTNEVTFVAPCCRKLCIHALYSFYYLDKLIDENPGLILTLCGIDINAIMNELAVDLIHRTININSDRILGEEVLNHIIEIEWD